MSHTKENYYSDLGSEMAKYFYRTGQSTLTIPLQSFHYRINEVTATHKVVGDHSQRGGRRLDRLQHLTNMSSHKGRQLIGIT